jgi:hypothetical protein
MTHRKHPRKHPRKHSRKGLRGSSSRSCQFGVNKNTGKCLKHPRRK